ncbi:MAG: ATP-binding protein [Oscillospiraceae bacterium]|nr:ATP-binding protein [Ruminococcus sp.]MCD8345746.1 ATP-binding protein [Oscillospiraceae bacterium]
MEQIKRDLYLGKLIDRRENGLTKVITGIRRCGKSYLLFNIYYNYLLSSGVPAERILRIPLDDDDFSELRESKNLSAYIKERLSDDGMWYLFLDEVQLCNGFEGVLNGLNRRENLDIYVTGSNSKFLSSDILTEFRGRGDEVRVYPLSFSEYYSACQGDRYDAWRDYSTYGGLPRILSMQKPELKSQYLVTLCHELYFKDIEDRNNLKGDQVMETLVKILASSIGSLTNPSKLANTFLSNGISTTDKTISSYIGYLIDAFFINRAERFDIKGKKYISSPFKYYFTDIGLRNAQLNFRQQEVTHIMENIIYNELLTRGFNVDVGVVPISEGGTRKLLEVDFVCNLASKRYYIQSAYSLPTEEKLLQEQRSLEYTGDFFKKIIITSDNTSTHYTDDGILIMNVFDFLLNQNSLDI